MANIKQQIKRIRYNEKNRLANFSYKSKLKTSLKDVHTAVSAKDLAGAEVALNAAYKALDKALAKGIDSAILDIGLKSPIKGSKIFAALKGAVDAGLEIPHGDFVFPADERIRGEHIAEYAESLDDDKVAELFSQYLERGLQPVDLPENFDEAKKNIDEAEV